MVGAPRRGKGEGEGKGRRGEEKGGKVREGRGEGKGREKRWEGMKREGRENGTGRGPEFKKNDAPSSDGCGAIHERAYDRYRTHASRTTAVRQAQVIHKKCRTYDVRKVVASSVNSTTGVRLSYRLRKYAKSQKYALLLLIFIKFRFLHLFVFILHFKIYFY